MPHRCESLGRPAGHDHLVRCPYDAVADDQYCCYHRAVVDGRIQSSSWNPRAPRIEEEHDEFEQLLREWA
jgi:hypothetical protein